MISGAEIGGAIIACGDVYSICLTLYAQIVYAEIPVREALRGRLRGLVVRLAVCGLLLALGLVAPRSSFINVATGAALGYLTGYALACLVAALLVRGRHLPRISRWMQSIARQSAAAYPEVYQQWQARGEEPPASVSP